MNLLNWFYENEAGFIFRHIARYTSLIIALFVMVHALFSSYDDYGGEISGILQNSYNAIPWVVLFFSYFIAWYWELIGGLLVMILGFAMLYFFNFNDPGLFSLATILSILNILLGIAFILSWYFNKEL